MEGINTKEFDEILGLEKTGYATVAAVACGYRVPNDPYAKLAKSRFDADDVITVIE